MVSFAGMLRAIPERLSAVKAEDAAVLKKTTIAF